MSYLEELLPEFRKGAKIRQNNWDEDVFIYFYNDQIYWKDSGAWKDGKIASTKDLVSIFTLHDNNWELYQDPIDWDCIIKKKCLCWFWDDDDTDGVMAILVSVYKDSPYRYYCRDLAGCGSSRKHFRPIRKDEVTFYEDKRDD